MIPHQECEMGMQYLPLPIWSSQLGGEGTFQRKDTSRKVKGRGGKNSFISDSTLNCPHCCRQFIYRQNYDKDVDLCLSKVSCVFCSEVFKSEGKRNNHQSNCPVVTCNACGHISESKDEHFAHVRDHNNVTFVCKTCEGKFNSKKELVKHQGFSKEEAI